MEGTTVNVNGEIKDSFHKTGMLAILRGVKESRVATNGRQSCCEY